MDQDYKALAKPYFEAYPNEHVIHFTSDGQAFLQQNYNDAYNHQLRIDKTKKIESVERKEKVYVKGGEQGEGNVVPDSTWKKADIVAWINASGAGVEAEESEKKEELLKKVADILADAEAEEEDEDPKTGPEDFE